MKIMFLNNCWYFKNNNYNGTKNYIEISSEQLQQLQNEINCDCDVIVFDKIEDNTMYFHFEQFEC